uniref:TonB-dependent receptor domain-containing protein n=1 Tax=Sphingomonas elodea TaxID=179878 RepID=UPI0002632161
PPAYNAGYGGAGLTYQVAANGQVILNYYNSGGAFDAKNKAFYLQDEWRITDRLTLNLGVRRDDFSVNRPDGKRLVNLDKNYAPRIGATLNLWGNQSGKLYASYGSYFLPFASNTAFRQTGREVYFRERWRYSGFDGNGIPILTTQVATNVNYQVACPFKLTPTSSGQNCSVTGNGTVPDSSTAIAANLKATKENELVFGYEHKFGRWTVGLNFTHRTLVTNAEDVAIDQAVLAYCTANKIAGCEDIWTGFHQYSIVNPGNDVTINLSGLDGRQVTFKANTLGYPKAKRTYDAVDLTFNRPWDGKWSVGGSYTWSQAKGNSEGFVQSDFGQSDAGITQDFDQPSFLQGAYGYLPTDVRHRIKLWGSVALSDAFTFGTNIQVQSPRSLSCFGYNPGSAPGSSDPYSDFGNVYDQASRYCAGGQQIGVSDSGIPVYGSVFTPRGTAQKSQWQSTINLSARYNIKFGERTVTLRGDVFNLFNSQAITKRNEVGDLLGVVTATNGRVGVSKNPNYGLPTVYQAPRYVRLGIDVTF